MMAATKLSAKEAAKEIGTDARTLRKFIRSNNSGFDACGQGNRYEFTSQQVKSLKKAFLAWAGSEAKAPTTQPETKKARKKSKKDPVPDMTHVAPDDEVEEVTIEDLEGPADEELEDIEVEELED